MSNLKGINVEQGLFVISCAGGYSCLGFDAAQRLIVGVSEWLAENGTYLKHESYQHGTEGQYQAYLEAMKQGKEFNLKTGKTCNIELVPQFVGREGERVECTMYGEKVRFYIGKSSGWMPCHLEIKAKRSRGGGAIFASSVNNVRFL